MVKAIIYLLITILILVIIVIKVQYYFKIFEEFTTLYVTDNTKTGIGKYGISCQLCSGCPKGQERVNCSGTDEGDCSACTGQTYKSDSGNGECQNVPPGTRPTPNRKGWYCLDGYYHNGNYCERCGPLACPAGEEGVNCGVSPSWNEGSCQACGTRKYKSVPSNAPCADVPPYATTSDNIEWSCDTGYFKSGDSCSACSVCPDNLFETKLCTSNTDTICESTLIQGYGWGDNWVLGDGVDWEGDSYTLVNIDTSNFQGEIVQIAADGYQSSVFLTNDGKVFRCGHNQYKSLGMGAEPGYNYAIPHIFSNLSQIRITKISCGIIHTIFLAESGTVYGLCGESGSSWSNEGQSGTGNTDYDPEPTLISNLNNIIDISCSDSHSLFLKNDGMVWGCGGAHGLGTGYFLSPPSLTPIELSQINNVSKIAAGYDFSIALKNDGTVWGWGRKTERQLGNGFVCETWEGHCAHQEYNIVQTDLTANGTLSIGPIIDISCGRRHTLLLTETGDVYGCGDNSFGQLATTWWSTGTTNDVGETIYENKYFSYIRLITDNVTTISAKQESSTFLKNNGDVYACGYPQTFAPGLDSWSTQEVKKCNISNVSDLFIGFKRSFYISRK